MRRAHLGVFVLLLGGVILYTWPLVTDLPHLYPDNPDARVLTWAMVYEASLFMGGVALCLAALGVL
jgi:hypothetical protein